MKEHVIEKFKAVGLRDLQEVKKALDRAADELLGKKQILALESEWRRKMVENGHICSCGRKDMLTIDHIVPKQILIEMGFDAERQWMPENFVIMCRPCNALKSGRLDFSNPKTKEILTKLLERL